MIVFEFVFLIFMIFVLSFFWGIFGFIYVAFNEDKFLVLNEPLRTIKTFFVCGPIYLFFRYIKYKHGTKYHEAEIKRSMKNNYSKKE